VSVLLRVLGVVPTLVHMAWAQVVLAQGEATPRTPATALGAASTVAAPGVLHDSPQAHTNARNAPRMAWWLGMGAAACVAALAGGAAYVTSIDSSAPALALAASNVARNGFASERADFLDADVNASLRRLAKEGRTFDAIVLDPPKLAPTVAHAERAARAYKDINRLALQILEPGGVLFTFSCSGGISADLFHKIVASAGADAGVDGFITERLGAAPDHPMTLSFPEGEYLKGLVVLRTTR
jgi:hypothetical protein